MSSLELTGLARIPFLMLNQAEQLGLKRADLLADLNVDEGTLDDPDARVGLNTILGLWRALIDATHDSALGLRLARSTKLRDYGLVGYSIQYSDTLRHALIRLCRYSRILSEALQFELKQRRDLVDVELEPSPRFDILRHPIDSRLASVVQLARQITGADVDPVEVSFPYPRPDDLTEHRRFFNAPLRFGEPQARVVLRAADLERPVVAGDDTLSHYLDRIAEEILKGLADRGSIAQRVQRTLWNDASGGQPTLEKAARSLGMSARSLQRRLKDEGWTFSSILERFRQDAANRLLGDSHVAVAEVAFLLGYSEPSTFYRAFRRWQGMTPSEFRATTARTG